MTWVCKKRLNQSQRILSVAAAGEPAFSSTDAILIERDLALPGNPCSIRHPLSAQLADLVRQPGVDGEPLQASDAATEYLNQLH